MHPFRLKQLTVLSYILIIILLAGCGAKKTLRGVFKQQTPYERYASSLKDANLHETALGSSWLQAGEKALQDSLHINLPFKEVGYFAADKPKAHSYRFTGKQGLKIVVNLETKPEDAARVYMDLYEVTAGATSSLNYLTYADTVSSSIEFEVEENQTYLLRIQPELLRSLQYTLTIKTQPTLAFPVPSKKNRGIDSFWGDPRDGGSRNHEGVDIFAPRGAPAIAAVDGIVTRVGTNRLGGNVVWLSDAKRRQNLYYAHLDKQLVTAGQRVQVGDTIGLIGNTGNARHTKPHLHFGIYRSGHGATNPAPYISMPRQTPPAITADLSRLGGWVRITPKMANVRLVPSTKSNVYMSLPQHTPLLVLGGTSSWYRVQLPDGTESYVATSIVESIAKPIRQQKLSAGTDLLADAVPLAAPQDSLTAGSNVAVLAIYNNYSLVRSHNGSTGWISSI
ncbi:peptidoglycan DD-metalloendopeptidase family protein [Pontibacter harenae]|uniref:peptidoglycan DD-metalloendopeptidase family protein n=1 Tax=Pontibacter harenae TaxID=2894083 RepID=UPI001E5DBA48|nr:peptidoglycan DD-metalloendopeptidase family protein [Pontibacter harenae]MCC9166294.1 peptidoglycan DD-metalloendopeptidase family protein [Pontibacter harenae]